MRQAPAYGNGGGAQQYSAARGHSGGIRTSAPFMYGGDMAHQQMFQQYLGGVPHVAAAAQMPHQYGVGGPQLFNMYGGVQQMYGLDSSAMMPAMENQHYGSDQMADPQMAIAALSRSLNTMNLAAGQTPEQQQRMLQQMQHGSGGRIGGPRSSLPSGGGGQNFGGFGGRTQQQY